MKIKVLFLGLFLSFAFSQKTCANEELPPTIEKEVETGSPTLAMTERALIFKLTNPHYKENSKDDEVKDIIMIGDSDDEDDLDIFKEPLWVEGKLNPIYKEWYSKKLHNLIQYINLYTFRNLFLIMPTTTTDVLKPGTDRIRVGGNFSTIFFRDTEGAYDTQFDYEVLEGYLVFNYGVVEDVEVGVYARSFHYSGGRLDHFKNQFEETIGLSAGSRGNHPLNQYEQALRINGEEIQTGKKNEVGLGDLITTLKVRFVEETSNSPSAAVLTALKLPTGNKNDGFGSGTTDVGASLVLSKHFTKRIKTHLNVGAAKPGGDGNFPNTATVYSLIPAIEYAFNTKNQIAFQVNVSTSPFKRIPTESISENSFNIGLAYTRHLDSGSQFHLYFMDELDNEGDTDYVVGFAFDIWPLFGKKEE
ncbi:MAG: DUF3187 family protein [Deltaproteobacteria bacterium]|nr:DUF3187 family protein [Deltaproteobacteria bacterium]